MGRCSSNFSALIYRFSMIYLFQWHSLHISSSWIRTMHSDIFNNQCTSSKLIFCHTKQTYTAFKFPHCTFCMQCFLISFSSIWRGRIAYNYLIFQIWFNLIWKQLIALKWKKMKGIRNHQSAIKVGGLSTHQIWRKVLK